jgi:hypothetical protein
VVEAPVALPPPVADPFSRIVFITARITDEHAAKWLYDIVGTGEIRHGIALVAIET